MLVVSFKMTKTKIAIMLFCCLTVLIAISAVVNLSGDNAAFKNEEVTAKTNEERIAFLAEKGWEVDETPAEIIEVVIPFEFDSVYEKYNKLQKEQGFDLTQYKGKRVKRYTYTVTNYPGEQESPIIANILVYEDKIIGGDICSTALGGFIHGFSTISQ